jgi:preprotein translocase subunit SecE
MANSSVETVNASSDKLMLVVGVLLLVAGFVGFFWLGNQVWYIRALPLLVGVVAGAGVALASPTGKSFIAFAKEAQREVRKVVWPSRKETTQTTLVVFAFVLLMAIFLWLADKSIEWLVFSVILGWK